MARKLHFTFLPAVALAILLSTQARADELDDLKGRYTRQPAENDWHIVDVTREPGAEVLRWQNKAGIGWTLVPDLKNRLLHTDKSNPYFAKDPARRDVTVLYEGNKPVGLRFGGETYVREGATLPRQSSHGLHGYITVAIEPPPKSFAYGFSFYCTAFPLLEKPLAQFQAGLAGTWITPDNADFNKPLVPPGTVARDTMPERGPVFRDVFQTIEGSLGFWGSTRFGSAAPKYRMNGTTDGYTHEISSPGWGFGVVEPAPPQALSIAQLSNRLLVPPDGLTFDGKVKQEVMGVAWMALPLVPADGEKDAATGEQSWTFFANTANFAGPVAFWVPDAWSRLSREYPVIAGRGLDARPGMMGSLGMEIGQVPAFEARDKSGTVYRRIPKLSFPSNARGETPLALDIAAYSKAALFDWFAPAARGGNLPAGRFDMKGAYFNKLKLMKAAFDQGGKKMTIFGTGDWFEERLFGKQPSLAYGLKWKSPSAGGRFPEYFKEADGKITAIAAAQVPPGLNLAKAEFNPAPPSPPYTSPEDPSSVWNTPGPKAGPLKAVLSDGSEVTYKWYRFADQPTIVAQRWNKEKREQLQRLVEQIHAKWPMNGAYMPPPSQGTLAKLDPALIVTPPQGLERGYVPIVTRQGAK